MKESRRMKDKGGDRDRGGGGGRGRGRAKEPFIGPRLPDRTFEQFYDTFTASRATKEGYKVGVADTATATAAITTAT
jgi:hypothetical protein